MPRALVQHKETTQLLAGLSKAKPSNRKYRMRFNFRRVYISWICNFRVFFNSRLLGTVLLKYSRVKYSQIYAVSPYTIIVYGTCRGAKLAGLDVGFI